MPTKAAKKVKGGAKAKSKKAGAHKAKKKPVMKAKAAPKGKPKLKLVKSKAPKAKAKGKAKAAPKESIFARLLREKRERQEKAHAERHDHQTQFGHQQARMPLAHIKFSKFAGPRRRAA